MLIGSIPGAFVAGKTITLFNPVRSNIMATSVLTINTIAAAIFLKGPGDQLETYILAVIWGLGTGWKWTTDRLLASTLIPEGQDAELMGVYLFAGQVLSWIPPLVFTGMNEAGVSQSIGIGSLSVYFFLGLIALCMIGDYRKAVAQTGRLSSAENNSNVSDLHPEGAAEETIRSESKMQEPLNVQTTVLHSGTFDEATAP